MSETKELTRVSVMEVQSRSLFPATKQPARVAATDLDWLSVHWVAGGRLFQEHPNFANAFVAFDQSIWTTSHGLGLVQLWGAFELLFATSRYRKTHQLASRISAFLERPGEGRAALKNEVVELYHSRSDAAHGAPANQEEAFYKSYYLLRRVLLKNLENNYVLSVGDLENLSQPEAVHRLQ
jgi:hypothetical protein